jgi:predicted nucleotide-binding protein
MQNELPITNNKEPLNKDIVELKKRTRRPRDYPRDTLENTLDIAKAIYGKNAGRPIDRIMLAKAIGRTPASSAFRSLITSSLKYQLTEGNYNDPTIELTAIGEAIVGAKSPDEKKKALIKAALTPEVFNAFCSVLDQKKFPDEGFAHNLLRRDFGISPELCEECLSIIKSNADYVGITTMIGSSTYISLSRETQMDEDKQTPEADKEKNITKLEQFPQNMPPLSKEINKSEDSEVRVFISHGKNQRILEQVKTMLEFGKYPFEVAIDTETTAIPVPQKIQEAMKRCNAGVIIVSADEPNQLADGRYDINQNVLIEIGAAFVLYDRRVVLLADKRINLPSNLQGLYKCEYLGDELSWEAGLKLQKAITSFRNKVEI